MKLHHISNAHRGFKCPNVQGLKGFYDHQNLAHLLYNEQRVNWEFGFMQKKTFLSRYRVKS